MNTSLKLHPLYGECLYADNGVIEIAVPLAFGLRVGHFSFTGEENVFFVQPSDMNEFTTPDGWRIRGGHRLWLAPEAESTYCPDNEPIHYEITEDCLLLTQKEDPCLHIVKQFLIRMEENKLFITHRITNLSEAPLSGSLWAISVMAPGGTEIIPLQTREGGMDPIARFSFWDHTNPGDPRVDYHKDRIRIKHLPVNARYKIGVGHPVSPVRYELDSTVFYKHFEVNKHASYPDGNVSFETFFCRTMAEIETLSPLLTLMPGEQAEHREIWELDRK